MPMPADWLEHVNAPQTEGELAALRRSVARGASFGEPALQEETAKQLGLQATLRRRAGPGEASENDSRPLFWSLWDIFVKLTQYKGNAMFLTLPLRNFLNRMAVPLLAGTDSFTTWAKKSG